MGVRRPADEFGAPPGERELVLRLHQTQEDTPKGSIPVDATAPLNQVVDEIVRRSAPGARTGGDI